MARCVQHVYVGELLHPALNSAKEALRYCGVERRATVKKKKEKNAT